MPGWHIQVADSVIPAVPVACVIVRIMVPKNMEREAFKRIPNIHKRCIIILWLCKIPQFDNKIHILFIHITDEFL